jgi:hypothetical protein
MFQMGIITQKTNRLDKGIKEDCLGLESRLGGVLAVGAGGVDGVRIDEHVRIIVAARQEHHLASPRLTNQIGADRDADRPTISAGTPGRMEILLIRQPERDQEM